RWQRRWFVLYDDGELTYSVDEHPETIPQAIIDMTKVLEVTTAEDVTSHPHSIAITAPERVTFVKGTCPEETKWWFNVLSAFPKSKGRHKRNATFPGGQATTILQSQRKSKKTVLSKLLVLCITGRNRHNSYHKDMLPSPVVANLEALTAPCSWNPAATDENNLNANNENSGPGNSTTTSTTTGSNLGGSNNSNNVNAKGKSLITAAQLPATSNQLRRVNHRWPTKPTN
ncbi:AAEL008667-PA, partial [Aedes aegypti]